jgi:hypothetical protein
LDFTIDNGDISKAYTFTFGLVKERKMDGIPRKHPHSKFADEL